jgi:tripartite-type tricarboxylate transporter receptor subunit TctC
MIQFSKPTGLLTAIAAATALFAGPAHAAFPDKPLTLIVPFPAGGATDAMARLAAERLGRQLGQTIVVDNRAGAGGTIAADAAKHAAPDGYTLLFATTGTMAINPYIYKRLKYDPLKDFAPIGSIAASGNVLVVDPQVKATSVKELIALAKSQPGKLTYASAGIGSSSHLSGALFAKAAGIDLLHVPYKGSAPALSDFLGGRIDMMLDTASTHMPNVKAGKVRVLAVTSARRMATLPNVPTMAEAGLPGYDVTIWYGIVAPAAIPAPVKATLEKALTAALAEPDMVKALAGLDAEPMVRSSADFSAFIRTEMTKWRATTSAAGPFDLD